MNQSNVLYRLWLREPIVKRSIHIDDDLYEKLQYLSDNVFEASVSKIINVAIEYSLCEESEDVKYYKKPNGVGSIYRSLLLRKEFYDKLVNIKERTGISISRLVNSCIKTFFDDNQKYFSSLKSSHS